MLARRLLLLAAVLLLLTALAAGIAPREVVQDNATPVPQSTQPAGQTVDKTITATPGGDARVEVRRGDLLELQVTGDILDTVQIERLDRYDGIDPEKPARFEILVDQLPGTYPIRLVEQGSRIGSLEIRD